MSVLVKGMEMPKICTYCEWCDDENRFCHRVNNYISTVLEKPNFCPLVEVDDGWIPCSERLPKESGLYLVTRTDIIDDYAVDMRFFNREKTFVGWSGCEWHKDPIAWMELPKPYILEENEL